VLAPTPGSQSAAIEEALQRLDAGGSTAGGEGIRLAYATARHTFRQGANNRVILATDGDFNVGISDDGDLIRLIESERDHGVYLTVLGFGMGNLKDAKLEKLADHGNGHYAYIDSILEARRVFVEQLGATLQVVARDVKVPARIQPRARQQLSTDRLREPHPDCRRIRDDRKDAGDLGAGHSVTAFYELVPAAADPLPQDTFTLRLRYKPPTLNQALEISIAGCAETPQPSPDFLFAAAVTEFGMLLRDSKERGNSSYASAIALAQASAGDPRRAEFVDLLKKAGSLIATPPR
jgi:Ca-activated chloride channel family protein